MTSAGQGTAGRIIPGRRPGDRRVRLGRQKPSEYEVPSPTRVRPPASPAVALVRVFIVLIGIGTIVLMLPLSSRSGEWTPLVDALFTATSAVCVTGLVVVDTATYWSPFGQVAILLLFQLGGLGFMTASTFLLLTLLGRRTGLRDRMLVQASTGTPELGRTSSLVVRVAVFTAIAEGVGFLVLTGAFLFRGLEPLTATWWGLFHSVSAFNNAGFDLTGGFQSMIPFAGDPIVLSTLAVLFILGALGYGIVGDVLYRRRWTRLALETKVVLLASFALLGGGTIAILLLEWSNAATLGQLPPAERALNAAFMSATRTAGFASVPTGAMLEPTLVVLAAMMFIGGASGSTAGGIKVTTFSVLLIAIVSTIRGDPSATALGRRVPHAIVYRALAIALLAIAFVFTIVLALHLTTDLSFVPLAFEAISAFGTVGLSTGITPELPPAALVVLTGAMLAGRLGPLTLVLALAARARPAPYRPAVETISIG